MSAKPGEVPFVHPMEHIVIAMGKRGRTTERAYRFVATDLLAVMVDAGRLVQVEPWEDKNRMEKGGARFELPAGE